MRFVFIKDPHFCTSGPDSYKSNYLEDMIDHFNQIGAICKQVNAKALLIGGDVFLQPEPKRITHTLVAGIATYFKNFPVPIAGIIGNHDARLGIDHYHKYPINVLIGAGVYQHVEEQPLIFTEGDFKVKIGGVSYRKDSYNHVMSYQKQDEDFLVLLAHMFIGEYPGSFFQERVYGFDEFSQAQFDALAVGHEHVNRGVFPHKDKWFIDAGQITRTSASQSDRDLVPSVVVFSVTKDGGLKSKIVQLKHKTADEIFGVEKDFDYQEDTVNWDGFMEKLGDIFKTYDTADFSAMVQSTNYPDEIKTEALKYLC